MSFRSVRTSIRRTLLPSRIALAVIGATILALTTVAAPAQTASAKASHIQANFGKVPLSFEPNRGQTEASVQFLSRGQGYALYLTPSEAVLELQKPLPARTAGKLNAEPARQEISTLAMKLMGANHDAAATAEDILPGTVNYFTGNDKSKWQTALPTYKRIAYRGIYPGVDLVYYGNQRELEYDFVVSPAADAAQIGFEFTGATPKIDKKGDLVLAVAEGETRFHKPVVYQMAGDRRVPVEGGYEIADGKVGFALGSYDHSKALVIDPVLSYLTYLGGNQNELLNGIAADASGSAYVVGTTQSTNFPLQNAFIGTDPGGTNGNRAIFVTKFNSTGTALVYSTYLGGTGNTYGNGIAVDRGGNAYVVGYVDTGGYPVTPGAFQTICGGEHDAQANRVNGCTGAGQGDDGGVLTKLSPNGQSLVYSTYLGGDNFNSIQAVAVNAAGEAYVTGLTNARCGKPPYFPTNPNNNSVPYGCFPTTAGTAQDPTDIGGGGTQNFAFFTKFNATGTSLIYSSILGPNPFGPNGVTNPFAVAADTAGNGYIAGISTNTLLTTPGSYQPSIGSQAGGHAFVAKFDPTAQALIYSTFLTASVAGNGDQANGITTDGAGNAYVVGSTANCSFPTTAGAYQTQASFPPGTTTNCNAGFVSKLNPTGSALVWSTFLGNEATGNNNTTLNAVALGSDGSVYVAGFVAGTGFTVVNPVQTQTDFNAKALIARLNPAGSALLFSTTLGSTGVASDIATGIAVDPADNIYIGGQTNGFTLPVTPGAFQPTNNFARVNGTFTGFVAKIAPTITTTTTLTLVSGTVTAGQPVTFTAKVAGPAGTTAIPTGTVTFLSGSTTLGTGTLDATGTASYTTPSLNATTYNVTASYSGDSNFSPSVSTAQSLIVAPATATVTLTAPATAAPGASVTLAVKVTGSNGTPTGTVTFMDGTTALSTVTLSSGAASFTTTAFAIGSHSLTVSYTGDSIFGSATSSTQTLVVGLVVPTVTLTAPATAVVGASVTLSASVAGTSGTPTGSVTFTDGSTVLSTVTLSSGTASFTTTALTIGTHTITASYSGDATFSPATSAATTVTISVASTISFAAAPASLTIAHGASGSVVITGTPVGGFTGTVTFACGTLPAGASCTFAPASLVFSGNNAAASTTLTFATSLTTTGSLRNLPGAGALGGIVAAVLLMPFAFRRKRFSLGSRLLLLLVLVSGSVSMLGLSGCSGGLKTTTITTAPGLYVVPVTVTAGTTVSTLNLSITVQ